jgi:hypothetical protein
MAGAARASPQLVYATLVLALVSAHVSVLVRAQDTLTADRPLSGDAKLVSRGGKFALGFFQPGIYAHVLYSTRLLMKKTSRTSAINSSCMYLNSEHIASMHDRVNCT